MNALSESAVALTQAPSLVAAQCLPSDPWLVNIFKPVIDWIAGGIGGILPTMGLLVVLILAVVIIARSLTKDGATWMKRIVQVAGFVIVIPVFMMLIAAAYMFTNNICSTSVL